MKATTGTKQKDKRPFRQRITDAFALRVEEVRGLPWSDILEPSALRPFNPSNGVRFKGGNLVTLLLAQAAQGSSDPRWMTMSQANKAGYWIRKGAKPTYVEYWVKDVPVMVPVGADEQRDGGVETPASISARSRPFYVQLFNGADVEGLPDLVRDRVSEADALDIVRMHARHAGIVVEEAARKVNARGVEYNAHRDVVTATAFKKPSLHAMSILTGLAERSGRQLALSGTDGAMSPSSKARFELIVSVAASQLGAMVGLAGHDLDAVMSDAWATCVRANMHEVFRIARDAEAIVEHVVGTMPELREFAEKRLTANLLPAEPLPRKLASGISKDLPNFIPADVQVANPATVKVSGVGRDDTRWVAFEEELRAEGLKHGVRNEAIEQALGLVERQFTGIMNGALSAGVGAEDMRGMLVRNLVGEMRVMQQREEQWTRFSAQVKSVGAGAFTPETLDLVLQELSVKYRQVIADGARENWERDRTTEAILKTMFGDGERKITAEYVTGLVSRSEKVRALLGPADDDVLTPFGDDGSHLGDATLDDDDDALLTPLGGDGDMGEIADERLAQDGRYLMADAEIYEP